MALFLGAIVFWILAWSINIWIARQKEKKIFIAPGTIFGSKGEGYIRFSLCIEEDKIIEAIKRCKE